MLAALRALALMDFNIARCGGKRAHRMHCAGSSAATIKPEGLSYKAYSSDCFNLFNIISAGVRYFFLLLHALQHRTTFPFLLRPPLDRGTTWSMVSSSGRNFAWQ